MTDQSLRDELLPERKEIAGSTDSLRDRLRRAICEAEGFTWDTDMLEPDEYGDHADAILAVLGPPAAGLDASQPATDRCTSCEHSQRYHDADGRCWFTVEYGLPGRDLVCPCKIRHVEEKE